MTRVQPKYLITNYKDDGTPRFYDVLPCPNPVLMPRDIASNESIVLIHPSDAFTAVEVTESVSFMGGIRYYLKSA